VKTILEKSIVHQFRGCSGSQLIRFMEALFFTPNIISCTHLGLMQSIRDKVKNCMILCSNGHGSSVVEIDPESGVVFRLDRLEFLCSAAFLGWFDETDRLSVEHFLTESQNTLLQNIMEFRMQANLYAGVSFDDFSFLSCRQHWYDVVNRHNQHVTKRLFFHARPLTPDAGAMHMEADQVPGQQHLQLQPSPWKKAATLPPKGGGKGKAKADTAVEEEHASATKGGGKTRREREQLRAIELVAADERRDAERRLSRDEREQLQAIELVAAAMRRDAEAAEEAAHRASQTAQASDQTFP
jgi:hypothetical protein